MKKEPTTVVSETVVELPRRSKRRVSTAQQQPRKQTKGVQEIIHLPEDVKSQPSPAGVTSNVINETECKEKHEPSTTVVVQDIEDMLIPSPKDVVERLQEHYGKRQWSAKGRRTVLFSLIRTILSQNTNDKNSGAAFSSLIERFPTPHEIFNADLKDLEDAIRVGGLAATKSKRIQDILRSIHEKRGDFCLEYLNDLSTEEVKRELLSFPGVGPKTVACVLMFNMGREEFPVDTHVRRLCGRIGWTTEKATPEQVYEYTNPRIPGYLKYELHVSLIAHGRKICQAGKPLCSHCKLSSICRTGKRTQKKT